MIDWPRRGDVWWVEFDPSIGGEIQKTRPAVVVSNNGFNRVLNRIQVVPLTSNISRVYPGNMLVSVGDRQSKASADQLFTASKLRLKGRLGRLSENDMLGVEEAIRIQLGF